MVHCPTRTSYGNREITVSTTANTTTSIRTAILTVTSGDQSRQVTVEQAAGDITLSTDKMEFEAYQSYSNLWITSTLPWTITSDQSWCTVQPASGNGNGQVIVYVSENNTAVSNRIAVLTIMSEGVSKQVTVEQKPYPTLEVVSSSTIEVSYIRNENLRLEISVSSDAWIASDQVWCRPRTVRVSGGATYIPVNIEKNTTTSFRTATLTFTGNGNQTKQVTIVQRPFPTVEVSISSIHASHQAGSTYKFTVASNTSWWILLHGFDTWNGGGFCTTSGSGVGNGEVTVTITSDNTTKYVRSGYIQIDAGDAPFMNGLDCATDVVFIEQKVVPSNIVLPSMKFVEGGTFTMGCTPSYFDARCKSAELPTHQVTVSDFYIGEYELTQDEWKAIMPKNPSRSSEFTTFPPAVENMSWNDIQEYIRRLNEQTGKAYRLPTEAEWEFAARGGNKSLGYEYSGTAAGPRSYSNELGIWNESHPTGKISNT